MLPKLSKNLFQAKAKLATKKAFNFKAFLITAFFAGTTAIAGTQLPAHISINDLIKKQNEVELTLKPAEVQGTTIASHRSHSSHQSHRSHYSHYSSYSDD